MGYETKLYIGRSCHSMDEAAKGELIFKDGEAYRPYLKDENGDTVRTGRKEIYFEVYAMIDLCKCGADSEISKVDWRNKESDSVVWYFYNGDNEIKEDSYGDIPKPVKLNIVLEALRKDTEKEDYRRFKWAVSLLESMKDDEEIEILFYGH